ncbi:hypothetical protein MNBD_GAMMA17-1792 [hydrothermal vent metagenome]|uniref:Multidrug transporter n=1 Tax=hydrothermal vent metagenome TaxID=652676 RepID=A0A3B1A9Y6_9ZZZZ
MKWIAITVVLLLFVLFPKKMLGGLGIAVLVGSIVGGFFYYQDWSERKVVEAVKVSVVHSLAFCDELAPLKITIDNFSDKTISMVEWNISAHQKGFSDDLAVPGYQIYSQDKILKPNARWRGCVGLPKLKRDVENASALVFSIKNRDAIFD